MTSLRPIFVPADVLEAIRQHAREMPDGFESCGRIVVRESDRRVVEYHRIRNHATEPGKARFVASWQRLPEHFSVVTHSHPPGHLGTPSLADLAWHAQKPYRQLFAIYSMSTDELAFFKVASDASSYERLSLGIEEPGARWRMGSCAICLMKDSERSLWRIHETRLFYSLVPFGS